MKYYYVTVGDDPGDFSRTECDTFQQACNKIDGYHGSNNNGPELYLSMIGFHGNISSVYVVWNCTDPTYEGVIMDRIKRLKKADDDIKSWIKKDMLTRKYDEE